jgi:L-ascorbate peroxidase
MPSKAEVQARGLLIELFRSKPCMPIMVRLAWHDAGTFSAKDNTGGANASIRFEPEISHGANAGLTWATQQLQVRRVGWEGSRWNGRRKRERYAV